MLHNTGFGSDFLDIAPETQAAKEKVDKLGFMKIYKFCASKAKKQTSQLKNGAKNLNRSSPKNVIPTWPISRCSTSSVKLKQQ